MDFSPLRILARNSQSYRVLHLLSNHHQVQTHIVRQKSNSKMPSEKPTTNAQPQLQVCKLSEHAFIPTRGNLRLFHHQSSESDDGHKSFCLLVFQDLNLLLDMIFTVLMTTSFPAKVRSLPRLTFPFAYLTELMVESPRDQDWPQRVTLMLAQESLIKITLAM